MEETITNTVENTETTETTNTVSAESDTTNDIVNAEIEKMKADMAKLKAANDKLAKENSEKTKALRAKQSAEEAAAEEAREAQEAQAKELAELRKKFAVAETSKKVMGFVGDESVSSEIAEYLYGAEDVDAALAALNRAWVAKEKALKLEFGKIPAPSIGASDGPTITKEQLDAMDYAERVKFATEHQSEYQKLMGRG